MAELERKFVDDDVRLKLGMIASRLKATTVALNQDSLTQTDICAIDDIVSEVELDIRTILARG